MPEFIRKLIEPKAPDVETQPNGRRTVTSQIDLPHGGKIRTVREDILKKGLHRKRIKQVA